MKRSELQRKTPLKRKSCMHIWDYDAPSTSRTAIDRCLRCGDERPSKKAAIVAAGSKPKRKLLKRGRGLGGPTGRKPR